MATGRSEHDFERYGGDIVGCFDGMKIENRLLYGYKYTSVLAMSTIYYTPKKKQNGVYHEKILVVLRIMIQRTLDGTSERIINCTIVTHSTKNYGCIFITSVLIVSEFFRSV
jgi:hypothetical protein